MGMDVMRNGEDPCPCNSIIEPKELKSIKSALNWRGTGWELFYILFTDLDVIKDEIETSNKTPLLKVPVLYRF